MGTGNQQTNGTTTVTPTNTPSTTNKGGTNFSPGLKQETQQYLDASNKPTTTLGTSTVTWNKEERDKMVALGTTSPAIKRLVGIIDTQIAESNQNLKVTNSPELALKITKEIKQFTANVLNTVETVATDDYNDKVLAYQIQFQKLKGAGDAAFQAALKKQEPKLESSIVAVLSKMGLADGTDLEKSVNSLVSGAPATNNRSTTFNQNNSRTTTSTTDAQRNRDLNRLPTNEMPYTLDGVPIVIGNQGRILLSSMLKDADAILTTTEDKAAAKVVFYGETKFLNQGQIDAIRNADANNGRNPAADRNEVLYDKDGRAVQLSTTGQRLLQGIRQDIKSGKSPWTTVRSDIPDKEYGGFFITDDKTYFFTKKQFDSLTQSPQNQRNLGYSEIDRPVMKVGNSARTFRNTVSNISNAMRSVKSIFKLFG